MTLPVGDDPDRYDPSLDASPAGPLDPSSDPDRYQSPTLPGLLGDGAHEEKRDNFTWLVGLVSVFAFLFFISLLVRLGNGG